MTNMCGTNFIFSRSKATTDFYGSRIEVFTSVIINILSKVKTSFSENTTTVKAFGITLFLAQLPSFSNIKRHDKNYNTLTSNRCK